MAEPEISALMVIGINPRAPNGYHTLWCVPFSLFKAQTLLHRTEGHFPNMFKTAEVRPLLKKAGTDDSNFSNYRPISNLNTISKLIERLYLSRIQSHVFLALSSNMHQSAYKKQHSTETAILKILNDVGQNADTKRATLLIGLDLSSAFDTIDHSILFKRLRLSYGLHGQALNWVISYLEGRNQYIKSGTHAQTRSLLLMASRRVQYWVHYFSVSTFHLWQML